ncbi:T-cell surface glycoprotein CD4 [Phodopus roborovskii]|uniref:T-cell surface glycoprotein CD4 n=1 Tax=Phodopus roborovskii TaxID=109678 RepID=UPI0021E3EE56|nr:T-cell surface glycoprotein CD4 [Phodopus roborovskii]
MYQGISVRHLLLVLQLAQLPAVTQGKSEFLSREGASIELPCEGSQRKNMFFIWKLSDQTMILGNQNNFVTRAQPDRFGRFDSKSAAWDKGSFPLVINRLKVEDSDTYICEVENRKMEVDLWVFKVTASPGTRLLQGQSLTLSLDISSKVTNPSMQCKGPGNGVVKGSKVFHVPNVRIQDSGIWTCTVTQNQKKEIVSINISVLGFQKTSATAYKKEGESVEFSFPLNFGDETLKGELKWRAEDAPSPKPWVIFSMENKKVSVQTNKDTLKVQMAEAPPLHLKILQVSLETAGSGNLTLTLTKGTLHQEVTLVVMRLVQEKDTLTCEVRGPTSPKMRLILKPNNQEARVSKQEKVVQVPAPEAGLWQCLLYEGEEVKINSEIQVSSRGLNQNQPMFLAVVLGGTFSFLASVGFCILCCVKCRHQQRQAERMSQIKRLLSEKKTCQCSHRMQKTRNFI